MEQRPSFEDPLIEIYLAAVDRRLTPVPADRRASFLEELRAHIAILVEHNEEAGCDRSTAVERALSTMGAPQSIGRSYARVWARSTERGNVLAAFALITLIGTIGAAWSTPYIVRLDTLVGDRWGWLTTLQTSLLVAGPLAAGGFLAGAFLPKGAIKAAVIRAAITAALTSIMLLLPPHETWTIARLQVENALVGGAVCIGAAWLGRRCWSRVALGV